MAISDSFNLANALNSQSYAYKCWYNYKYGNNTMQISANDMNKINQTWSSELAIWKANALDDENKYEIEDDDFSKAVKDGKESAKDDTGYEGGGKGKMITRGAVDAAGAGTGAILTFGPMIKDGIKKIASKFSKKGTEETAKNASKEAGKGAWVTAAIAIATSAHYYVNKPNKEQKEACDVLRDETLPEAMGEVDGALQTMEEANEETLLAAETAQEQNDAATETLETDKTEFDFYNDSIKELSIYNSIKVEMATASENLDVTAEETQEIVEENHDIMLEQVDKYDDSATNLANVQGITDYAESFDSTAKTMCNIECISQSLNSASGATAGAKLCATAGLNIGQWIMGGASIAAGVASGVAAAEQGKWAGDIGAEIASREATQDFNSEAQDIYDESIEFFDGAVETVEELELPIPEDMEVPEENLVVTEDESEKNKNTQTGVFGTTVATTGSNGATNTENPQNNKKEKEK